MANILFGIGILLLYISTVFFILYFFEINNHQTQKCNNEISKVKNSAYEICKNDKNTPPQNETPQVIYSDRPTVTFKKMFLEPSIWLGYESVPNNV